MIINKEKLAKFLAEKFDCYGEFYGDTKDRCHRDPKEFLDAFEEFEKENKDE